MLGPSPRSDTAMFESFIRSFSYARGITEYSQKRLVSPRKIKIKIK